MNGKDISDIWEPKDPYDYLTKLLSAKGIKNIEPRLCNESASNTILACFQVGIYTNKKLLGIGKTIIISENSFSPKLHFSFTCVSITNFLMGF